jgi:hypothetical protein
MDINTYLDFNEHVYKKDTGRLAMIVVLSRTCKPSLGGGEQSNVTSVPDLSLSQSW